MIALWALSWPAAAARLAFVVGIDSYQYVRSLENARADARALAGALTEADFQVTIALDLPQKKLLDELRAFTARVQGGDQVVFYFSGHGVQLGDTNYLIPSDVRNESGGQVRDDAVSLSRVLMDLRDRRPAFTLAVIDACRDNPFADSRRAIGGRFLTGITAATGQMVVYSAGEGQKALDKLGPDDRTPNGLFTRVFVEEMRRPGRAIRDVVFDVRGEVARLAATVGHNQVPATYDQALGRFYFHPPRSVGGSSSEGPLANVAVEPSGGGVDFGDLERARRERESVRASWTAWQSRMEADFEKAKDFRDAKLSATAWQRFLDAYGDDNPYSTEDERLRAEARKRLSGAMPAGQTFKDCNDCPEMVVIPSGSFEMGSPPGEAGRDNDEGPQHRVTISRAFALGRYEVTVGQFRNFVEATGYRTDAEKNVGKSGCYSFGSDGKWDWRSGRYWANPGFTQGDDQPVVCLSWNDAREYARWLSGRTGQEYRLPSEAEWEYAARAETRGSRPWGEDPDQACRYANVADRTAQSEVPGGSGWTIHNCRDGHAYTAPVGRFDASGFGLHDMIGNVLEWTQDCYQDSYAGAPSDGSARESGDCGRRVLRGGSWLYTPQIARSAYRFRFEAANRYDYSGLRLARTLR